MIITLYTVEKDMPVSTGFSFCFHFLNMYINNLGCIQRRVCDQKGKSSISDKELKEVFCCRGLKKRGGTQGLCDIYFQILKRRVPRGK